jgi:hypothetical protein
MRVKQRPLLTILLLLPLAFDYRSADDDQGHWLQIALVAPALIAGVLLALIGPRFRTKSLLRSTVTAALLLTIVGSVVTQFVQGNEVGNYLRVILAFVLFLIGYFVGCHPWSESRLNTFVRYIFIGMTLSMAASFLYGMAKGGPIDDVRYRIVSPVLLGFQGMLLYDIVVRRSANKLAAALFVATLIIELLSVTRSLLIGTVLLFFYATWLATPTVSHLAKSLLRTFAIVVAIGGVVATGAAWIFPSVLAHWSQRIFFAEGTQSGKDPTTLSRLAEIQDQYDQLTSSMTSMLAGKGYGHEFHYAQTYIVEMLEFASRSDLEAIHAWAAGHNFWMYQIFAGGILFGIAMPAALLYAFFQCTRSYWRRRRHIGVNNPDLSAMGRYLMMLVAMLVTTIGGNPLGPRYSGLVYGLGLGLLVAAHSRATAAHRTAPLTFPQNSGSHAGAHLIKDA